MDCTNEACGKFFDDMDLWFQPTPLGATPPERNYSREAGQIIGLLRQRRDSRMADQDIPFPQGAQLAPTRTVSERLVELFRRHFGGEQLDFSCIQTCFVRFAYGELRTRQNRPGQGDSPAREPDGQAFFLFAEFALLAIQCEFDAEIWKQLFNTFAKTSELFIIAYPPIQGLTGEHNRKFRKPPDLSDAQRAEYHERYSGLPHEDILEKYRTTLRRARQQPEVAYLPSRPMDPDGQRASLRYGELIGGLVTGALQLEPRDPGVARARGLAEKLLALREALGPGAMPRTHGFPGSFDEPDEYSAARIFVADALRRAELFVETVATRGRG